MPCAKAADPVSASAKLWYNPTFKRILAGRRGVLCLHQCLDVQPEMGGELLLAETVVGIGVAPVVPEAQRNCREIRTLLPKPTRAETIGVGCFDWKVDRGRSLADSTG